MLRMAKATTRPHDAHGPETIHLIEFDARTYCGSVIAACGARVDPLDEKRWRAQQIPVTCPACRQRETEDGAALAALQETD